MPAKSKSKKAKVTTPKKPLEIPPVENPAPPQELPPVAVPPPPPAAATSETGIEEMLDSEPVDESHRKTNVFLFTLGAGIAVTLIAASIVVFVIYLGSSKVPDVVLPEAPHAPEATPTPYFSRISITFEVLNASGVAGAAGKGAAKLTELGYTVISTGNAKKQTQSQLFISPLVTAAATTELLTDTQSLFTIGSSSGELTGSTASARLILGVK